MKNLIVLGSTGSIGTQALEVARALPGFRVAGLAAGGNIDLFERQVREHLPRLAALRNPDRALELKRRLAGLPVEVLAGPEGVREVAAMEGDLALNAIVGSEGLLPTLAALESGKTLALANKESLVTAGELVTALARKRQASLLPVDSEHSAIFQCLQGSGGSAIEKLILTASGGPFRGKSAAELRDVTREQALRHPNWSMGAKITVDCATLMNKGLELMEAAWLFGVPMDKLEVVVHPQSVIHSLVRFADGAVLAQLGLPDMRLPIQYALTYPRRLENGLPRLDLAAVGQLTFEPPDEAAFPCLRLAREAMAAGGLYPAVLNGANEQAVTLFLQGKIGFPAIPSLIEKALSAYTDSARADSAEAVLAACRWGGEYVISAL